MVNFGLSGPQFNLRAGVIATNLGNGTFGTPIPVPSIQLFGVALRTLNGQLEGDGAITDLVAVAEAANVTLRFGGSTTPVWEIVTGRTIDETGVTPNRVRRLSFHSFRFPYFAAAGLIESSTGEASMLMFVPRIKVMEGFELRLERGQYVVPELTCMAIPDPAYDAGLIFDLVEYESGTTIDIPPA